MRWVGRVTVVNHRQETNERSDRVEKRLDRMDDRIAQLEKRMETRFHWVIGLMVTLFGLQTGLMLRLFSAKSVPEAERQRGPESQTQVPFNMVAQALDSLNHLGL